MNTLTTTMERQPVASIEDYRSAQTAMETLRAKHVTAAFTATAGDNWSPAQISVLVADLDLSRFVKADGEVDTAKVKNLLSSLSGVSPKTAPGTTSSSTSNGVPATPGDAGRAAATRRFGTK